MLYISCDKGYTVKFGAGKAWRFIMSEKIVIRQATTADVEAILNIYAKYVSDTTVSFEVEVPT